MGERMLTITDLAQQTGLSKHTLRYYEKIDLLPLVSRDPSSGHRRYRSDHVRWVAFLRELRATGMPVREVREYAKIAARGGEESWPRRRAMLAAHRERVAEKIAVLQQHVAKLDNKLELGCGPERHADA